jgi:ADP-glucose pyrophosphorylase
VLAQYNSTSLNRHLSRAYSFVNGAAAGAAGEGLRA